MRSSIRLRLMTLMLVPAVALLALSGIQLQASTDVLAQTQQFASLVDLADAQYSLVHDLQIERTRTLEAFHIGDDGGMDMSGEDLQAARSTTDASLARLHELASPELMGELSVPVADAIQQALDAADDLVVRRGDIDAGSMLDAQVQQAYDVPVGALLGIDDILIPEVTNPVIHTRLLASAAYARLKATALDRGDTILLAVAGSIDSGTAGRRVSAQANQQALWLDSLRRLATDDEVALLEQTADIDPSSEVSRVAGGLQAGNLGAIDEIAADNRDTARTLRTVEQQMAATSLSAADDLQTEATRTTFVIGGLVVLALLFGAYLVYALSRSVVRPLNRLTTLASRIATALPSTVEAVGRGEEVDTSVLDDAVSTELLNRRDELGDLARALGAATDQATTVALEQARTRHGVAQTISDVARREQSLVERQLSLLESMEDREEDAEQLSQLFRLDHLATRMRRNAENLLLLSTGQLPGSGDASHQPLVDVIRTAAAETEQYARVDVRVGIPVDVKGYAATPLSHLLAELVENATNFSPPNTRVTVTTAREASGVTVTVTDRGLGMDAQDLEEAKARLMAPPLLEAAESRRLGLYVVGLLAQRLGVAIDIRPGEPAGLHVLVWLPDSLFVTPPQARTGPAGLASVVAQQAEPAIPTGPVQPAALLSATPPVERTPEPAPAAGPARFAEDAAPDALSVMQRLLDASPSTPPPLPPDVQPVASTLPTRAPLLPQRQPSGDEPASGISLARASNGRTVDFDPAAVADLISGFDSDFASGPPPAPTPEVTTDRLPVATSQPGFQPQAPGPAGFPPAPSAPPAPAAPAAPVDDTPAAADPTPPTTPFGGTSSWSTPFPQRDSAK